MNTEMIKKNNVSNLKFSKRGGFTLIELMVSISVFMMIMLVAIGSLFISLDTSKKSRALRYAMDNVNFAMDSMSRSLRMGTNYTCGTSVSVESSISSSPSPSDCSTGNNGISMIPQDGAISDRLAYIFVEDVNGIGGIKKCTNGGSCIDIISPNADIEELKFFTTGTTKGDSSQAKTHIYMKGVVILQNGEEVSFAVQTLASQRNLE